MITIILNPAAGRGEGKRRRPEIESHLSKHGADWRVIETTGQGTATELAAKAAKDSTIVAAAGGDGTLNETLNGVIGTNVSLGLIPLGTGNDFGRHMGVPRETAGAVLNLMNGEQRRIDVGSSHGQHFLNIAGCGFDAAVAKRINDGYRLLRGTPAYIAAVVGTLATYKAAAIKVTLDGEQLSTKAMLCSIANASSYGGGMLIAPDARVDDGMFDVCILHEVGKMEFLRSFPKVFKGTHTSHPKMEIRRASKVDIESETALPILIDGEVRGTTPVSFEMHPAAISFVAPRGENAKE